jgi:hypothetical protein
MKNLQTLWVLGLLLLLSGLVGLAARARAVEQAVDATVKISVCGNHTKEGGEDCDNEDLNSQTCESTGYGPGTLDCQADCSFDISGCGPAPTATPTPTPTPTPTATPTPTPTPTTAATATSAPGPTATSAPAATATPAPIVVTVIEILPLPKKVATFDIDGDGQIATAEIKEAVGLWVEEWQKLTKKGGKAEVSFFLEEMKGKEEEKAKEKPAPGGLRGIVRFLTGGKETEEPAVEEEGLVEEGVIPPSGILGTVRSWIAIRLGQEAQPTAAPGLSTEEALQEKLERAMEEREEEALPAEEKKCDLNKDKGCDLVDFSILLYYINS